MQAAFFSFRTKASFSASCDGASQHLGVLASLRLAGSGAGAIREEGEPRPPGTVRCVAPRPQQRKRPMELARNLKVECVSRLCPTAALCLTPRQSVAEAVALMHQREVGCVLICDNDR